jgi:hypothetical protein
MSVPGDTVAVMDECRPLTAAQPWEEFGVVETLFPELPLPGARPVEVTVTVPYGGGRRCVMQVVAAESEAGDVFAMTLRECADVEGFEVTARRFAG